MDEQGDLQIDIERLGPEPETIEEISRAALEHPSSREYLSETRNRLLGIELLENPRSRAKLRGRCCPIVTAPRSTTTPTIG